MNHVFLIGRLCDDPKPFYDQQKGGELSYVLYTLAVTRGSAKGGGKVDFIPVMAFSHSAKFAMQYFKKGMRVAVDGPLNQGHKTNKDGTRAYTYTVVAHNQYFADGKQKLPEGAPEEEHERTFMDIADGAEEGTMFN